MIAMTKTRNSKLFRKYFSAFMIIVLVCFTFTGSAMLIFSTRYWNQDRLALLSTNTQLAAREITKIYNAPGIARQEAVAQVLSQNSAAIEAQFFVFNTEGRVIACREAVHQTPLPSPAPCKWHSSWRLPMPLVAQALASSDQGRFMHTGIPDPGGLFGESVLLSADPFFLDSEAVGFVLAAQPLSEGLFEYLGGILRLFLLSGMVMLVIAFVVVYLITRRLVRPLNDMVSATQHYAKGDFRYRVKPPESDELRMLAQGFNSMAVNLATLEASRRSFVANVSHELKTPMTSIGGFIDGMLDGTIPAADHEKYLTLVSGEVQRLSRLVTGMLNLSKIEAGELQMKRVSFDLSEMLFTTLLSFEQSIAAKQIELIGLDALVPISVTGDKDLLTQVFYNLIDNAVKFTPKGGQISLRAEQGRMALRIILRNSGAGIPSEELGHIFERFYKTDKSRSYDTRGAGLGLYLAKTIVTMHGGTISAGSDGASWTEFTVELPAN
jgi:signal transduction histidine kinase